MIKKNHYSLQKKYFNKEFSLIKEYKLASWQESYIQRIKIHLFKNKFKDKKLLDIATGTGYVAVEMSKLGVKVTACDLSEESVKNLLRYKKILKLKNLNVLKCKAEEIPLRNESFDYIVANAILEHIPEEEKAISLWIKLLKPSGKIFITVPLKFKYIWFFLWIPNMLHDKKIGHLRRYDLQILEKKFNLKTVKYFYTGHLIKVFSIVVSIFLKTDKYDEYFEILDRKKEKIKYGSNNISVIFQK